MPTQKEEAQRTIFTFKVLCEKAIISENYSINLLMLDMSKAVDTIERGKLIDYLKSTLENDELFLIYLLLKDIKLIVKLNNEFGKEFITNIGSPQGDSASAIFFILYLAKSLTILIKNSSLQLDHTYSRKIDEHIIIDQQYADDIGWASTNNEKIEEIENTVPQILKNRNLLVNESKTEKYTVERNGSDQWKVCKYVGSLLDTQQDIKRRKSLANQSYISVKDIYRNKDISLDTKLRIHNALIESSCLYNCEVWTTTKKFEQEIDVFQRNLLRRTLNIKWSDKVTNEELYERTQAKKWSEKVKKRKGE